MAENEKQELIAQLFTDTTQYSDIMDRPHHQSRAHLPMPREDRAMQFAPFAALTGYHQILSETAERYQRKEYLTLNRRRQINNQIKRLKAPFSKIKVVYFNGQSGYYEEYSGQLQEIDRLKHRLVFADGQSIVIPNIKEIKKL